ncbi:hypothetical protein MRX96_047675 [Rhipicephalus microplus]
MQPRGTYPLRSFRVRGGIHTRTAFISPVNLGSRSRDRMACLLRGSGSVRRHGGSQGPLRDAHPFASVPVRMGPVGEPNSCTPAAPNEAEKLLGSLVFQSKRQKVRSSR